MNVEGRSVVLPWLACCVLCVENPESGRDINRVAPAEGEKPLTIRTDSDFKAMSNPDRFLLVMVRLAVRDLKSLPTESISIRDCWMLKADLLEILIISLLPSIL